MPAKAEPLHPEDIKAAIRKRGKTLTQLSLDYQLAPGTVRGCLIRSIPAADKAVARFLNKPLHMIWPDRYDEQGNPLKPSRKKDRTNSNVRHRQKRTSEFTEGVK
ncbi:MAG: transcriptional regulator [Micavibrio aeruginosavorus]|uniref:Transcriptional regulator n=1 Tax=Micavibrio aeruginosavorus TaxID=349221 RepID=A0A2W5N121_9BACT|nr:MAG: transcriptional regulator [Micavibrio aeruginosavorus]